MSDIIETNTIKQQIEDWTLKNLGKEFSFRQHQEEIIIDIIDNIVNNKVKNNIIEAPTGSGKSLINIISAGVLADYYDKSSFILCSDRYLFKQYEDFIVKKKLNFGHILGQTGNYTCALNDKDLREAECQLAGLSWSALENPTIRDKYGFDCAKNCLYATLRRKAIKAKVTLMTYQLFLYTANMQMKDTHGQLIRVFGERDVIFGDECHNIPDIVQAQYSPDIKPSDFERLCNIYDFAHTTWVVMQNAKSMFDKDNRNSEEDQSYADLFNKFHSREELYGKCSELFNILNNKETPQETVLKTMREYANILSMFGTIKDDILAQISRKKLDRKNLTKDEIKVHSICTWLSNLLCFWGDFTTACNEVGYQYVIREHGMTNGKQKESIVTIHCIKEDYLVYRFFLSNAPYKVLCSATIGDEDAYVENTGMQWDEKYTNTLGQVLTTPNIHKIERIPSTFDFSKSPIYFYNKYKMSYHERQYSFPMLKKLAYGICSKKCSGIRGMIQTGSYALAKDLYNNAPAELKERMLLYNNVDEKNSCLAMLEMFDDGIIIGPTLNEGIDLPDDLCRFIIILKVPYPSMQSNLVKAKIKYFPRWYNFKTSNTIIQGIGRGVRNEHDWCVTYILDACFNKLYNETMDQYPKEMQKRIVFF